MKRRNIRELETSEAWDRFFDCLINTFYYQLRQQLGYSFGTFTPEPVIRFGGFDLQEPWLDKNQKTNIRCGWHKREPLCRMGELVIYNRYIYLNKLFLYQQLGFQLYYLNPKEFAKLFNLDNLIKVMAHELAHTLLTDLEPQSQEVNQGHGKKHDEYTQKFLDLIIKSPEYQELKKHWK